MRLRGNGTNLFASTHTQGREEIESRSEAKGFLKRTVGFSRGLAVELADGVISGDNTSGNEAWRWTISVPKGNHGA